VEARGGGGSAVGDSPVKTADEWRHEREKQKQAMVCSLKNREGCESCSS
jgi:hypothetical protein